MTSIAADPGRGRPNPRRGSPDDHPLYREGVARSLMEDGGELSW